MRVGREGKGGEYCIKPVYVPYDSNMWQVFFPTYSIRSGCVLSNRGGFTVMSSDRIAAGHSNEKIYIYIYISPLFNIEWNSLFCIT
jgi:hypothetical protein